MTPRPYSSGGVDGFSRFTSQNEGCPRARCPKTVNAKWGRMVLSGGPPPTTPPCPAISGTPGDLVLVPHFTPEDTIGDPDHARGSTLLL